MFSSLIRKLNVLVVLAISIAMLVFAAVNRGFIEISLFPFPYTIELPKFLLAIICFAAGLLVGGIVMSLKLGHALCQARKERKHAIALENEISGLKAESTSLIASK